MGCQSARHRPRAITVLARTDGSFQVGAEFQQFPDSGSAQTPLFPKNQPAAKTANCPSIFSISTRRRQA